MRPWTRFGTVSAALAAALFLARCGGDPSETVFKYFLFVLNTNSSAPDGNFHAHEFDVRTGQIGTRLPAVAIPQSGSYDAKVEGTADGKFVYAVTSNPGIYGYAIAADGGITALPSMPYASGLGDVRGFATRPDSKVLVAASSSSDSVQSFSIGANGALTAIGSPITLDVFSRAVAFRPNGSTVYVLGASGPLRPFTVAANGALTGPGTDVFVGSSPKRMEVDPLGRFLFITIDVPAVRTVRLAADGTPSLGAVQAVTDELDGIGVDPSGTHLYGASDAARKLRLFTIDGTTGDLTASPTQYDLVAGGQLRNVRVTPDGKFVIVSYWTNDSHGGKVEVFARNTTSGALTSISGSPFTICGQTIELALVAVPQPAPGR